uniref:Uncharacterized protein n=1 Tax=Rhizophora mucronata TaxID=61149 RepID=A0A2P2R476_RHIMU
MEFCVTLLYLHTCFFCFSDKFDSGIYRLSYFDWLY